MRSSKLPLGDSIPLNQRPVPVSYFLTVRGATQIYTLSLHDALPIYDAVRAQVHRCRRLAHTATAGEGSRQERGGILDRKSTRLNSSHSQISYAVFCLKKKIIKSYPKRIKLQSYFYYVST